MSPELIAVVKSDAEVIELRGALKEEFAKMAESAFFSPDSPDTGASIRAAEVVTCVKNGKLRTWYLGESAEN